MLHDFFSLLAVGYLILILYWVFRLASGFRGRIKRRKNVVQFRPVEKHENPVLKAVYNPKEFRRRRDRQ